MMSRIVLTQDRAFAVCTFQMAKACAKCSYAIEYKKKEPSGEVEPLEKWSKTVEHR